MSSSGRTRNKVAGTGEKNSRVPRGMGRKPESISSGNGGMTAAVLSPGDVFVDKSKNKEVIDINHFHVSLAHAHLIV